MGPYIVAYYDGETVVMCYATYEEAHCSLVKALEIDVTAKLRYPNGMPEDRYENGDGEPLEYPDIPF